MVLNKGIKYIRFIIAAAGFLLFAPQASALCDNVPPNSAKLITSLADCEGGKTQSEYAACFKTKYQPLCYQVLKNAGVSPMEATDTCSQEAAECAIVAAANRYGSSGTDSAPPSDNGSNPPSGGSGSPQNGSANCDSRYFESVNGVCVPKSDFAQGSLAGSRDWKELITTVIKWLLTLVGVIAVVAIVIGGYWYITSGGNEEQAEKGRKVLTNAIIGVVIVLMAYAIVTVVANTITGSKLG